MGERPKRVARPLSLAWRWGRFTARTQPTAQGPVTLDLLRRLALADLCAPGAQLPDSTIWRRHARQRREFVLVAVLGTAGRPRLVVGELLLDIGAAAGSIDRVWVQPAYRRLGIGAGLVQAAIDFARAIDVPALHEYVPGLLARSQGRDGASYWRWHEPDPDELGGLRSLRATARACEQADAPWGIVRAVRQTARCLPLVGNYERLGAEVVIATRKRCA